MVVNRKGYFSSHSCFGCEVTVGTREGLGIEEEVEKKQWPSLPAQEFQSRLPNADHQRDPKRRRPAQQLEEFEVRDLRGEERSDPFPKKMLIYFTDRVFNCIL